MLAGDIDRVAGAAYGVGLRGDSLITAIAIAGAESGYRLGAHGDVELGGSYGPWQVYVPAHPQYSPEWLTASYENNAAAMYEISGGGANWNPWTTYWNGAYVGHLDEATAAASRVNPNAASAPAAMSVRSDGLSEPFGSRLDALLAAFPGRLWVNSGFRSIDEQTALWEASDKSGVMVGSPTGSKHTMGMAADLGWDTQPTIDEVHAVAGDYGLWFPMSWENWHIEPIGSRDGTYVETTGQSNINSAVRSGVLPGIPSIPGLGALDGLTKLTSWVNYHNLIRVGQLIVGSLLALFGLYLLTRAPTNAILSKVSSLAPAIPKGVK